MPFSSEEWYKGLKEPLVIIRSDDGTCNFIRNFRASLPNYARHML